MALNRRKRRHCGIKNEKLDATSILNDYVICDDCGRKLKNKEALLPHIKKCLTSRTCRWCNVVLKNRANLYTHSQMHGKDTSLIPKPKKLYTCSACPKYYSLLTSLKYHIRQEHYNLKAKIVEGEKRKINDVWFERVLNSDALIQIKKCGFNSYLMKKAICIDPVKISECRESVDMSRYYPTRTSERVWCTECQKSYSKNGFKKHVNEKHMDIKRHSCNNCKRSFKRLYQYLQHSCIQKPRTRRKQQVLRVL